MPDQERLTRAVLREAGCTLASEAGIRMADRPAPLWRLLVLVNLLSARISAAVAVGAARELYAAGGTTPQAMVELSWQDRVDALDRGRYVRYDESTATRLGRCAETLLEEHQGDLRNFADFAEYERGRMERGVQRFSGIGPTGARIFCREAQAVWTWLRPYTDGLVRTGAGKVGLPTDEQELAALVRGQDMAPFAAGLARAARDGELAERVRCSAV